MSSRAGLQDLRLLCHLLRLPHQRASYLRRDFPFESSEPFPALSVWLAVMTQAFLIFPGLQLPGAVGLDGLRADQLLESLREIALGGAER